MRECQLMPEKNTHWNPAMSFAVADEKVLTSRYWLHLLLQKFIAGKICLPKQMGLDEKSYAYLCDDAAVDPEFSAETLQKQQLMEELRVGRQEECRELEAWLLNYVQSDVKEMATIIANASIGFSHLWEDLGLDSRAQLRELMQACFPELVVMNDQNMRWKKFFYRQRCEQDGGLVCRSPSCQACYERANCFAPD